MAHPCWLETFQAPCLASLRVQVTSPTQVATKVRGLRIEWKNHGFVTGEDLSIFNGWITAGDGGIDLRLEQIPATRVVRLGGFLADQIIELCSGLGGMSAAASALGLKSMACMDLSPLAIAACRRNHDSLVLEGDICNPDDLARLFSLMKGVKVGLLCGFPCPPFSVMCDQKAFGDSRSEVFVAALNAAFLFNSAYVILECTPTTGKYQQVQDLLCSFARAMNFECRQQILKLSDVWPCQRTRWWCYLIPAEAVPNNVILPSLPRFPHLQTVGDILPSWPFWSRAEEEALSWTPEEEDFYASTLVLENHELRQSGSCPTLLHSLGHHLYACPCGCRHQGLSHERLLRDGVALTMLPSTFSAQHYRHLHPCEAGYLCSLPADFIYNLEQARSDLPLIGQTAAPLQTMWVLLHVLHQLQEHGFGSWPLNFSNPQEVLLAYINNNLEVCKQLWPTCEHRHPQEVCFKEADSSFSCLLDPMTSAQQFLHAHQQLLGWAHRVTLFRDGIPQLPNALLRGGSYDVVVTQPRHSRPAPTDFISVKLHDGITEYDFHGPAGTRLSSVLESLGFSYKHGIEFSNLCRSYRWGDALWQSEQGEVRGLGRASPAATGVHHHELYGELHTILQLLPSHILDAVQVVPHHIIQLLINRPASFASKLLLNEHSTPFTWLIFPLLAKSHWSLLILDFSLMEFHYLDGLPDFHLDLVTSVVSTVALAFSMATPKLRQRTPLEQLDGDYCAAVLLHNVGIFFNLWSAMTVDALQDWTDSLKSQEELQGCGPAEYSQTHAWLCKFLITKGVPEADSPARATLALKKLGHAPIAKAISQANPWSALKQLANAQQRPFQWIQHNELMNHIQQRAKEHHGAASGPSKKPSKKRAEPAPPVSPNALILAPKSFVDEHDHELPQLQLDKVTPESNGIILGTVEQAANFLRGQKTISINSLAMLTTTEIPSTMHGKLTVQHMVWPALLADSADPILIRGSCIQLGDHMAKKVLGPEPSPATFVPELFKLQVYQDQWPHSWTDFIGRPLKALVQHFECLQFCDGSTCNNASSCKRFHPALEEEIDMVILDAFGWKWCDATGAAANSKKAASFGIMVRVPPSAAPAILAISATDGLYTELREPVSKGPSTKYAVIWIKGDLQQAIHTKCQTAKALHVVRSHQRYGLRCLATDQEAVHKVALPKLPFVAGSNALHRAPPQVMGSLQTLQRLQAPLGEDPLQVRDPWATALHSVPASSAPPASSKLDEISQQLQTSVAEQVREQLRSFSDSYMDTDDSRLSQMEASITELQAQSTQFAGWFAEAGERMQALSKQVSSQEGQLVELTNEVTRTDQRTEQLHQSVGKLRQDFQNDLEASMARQLESMDDPGPTAFHSSRTTVASDEDWGFPRLNPVFGSSIDVSTDDEHAASAPCLVVGTANPSGINGKALAFASLPWGIWNVAETQASQPVFARFQRELNWMTQYKLHCKHGHFAPFRPHSDFAGSWTGVAQISPGPIHPVPLQWQGASYQSGRIMLSSFALHEHTLLGASVYAPPAGPTYRNAKQLSSQLLEQLTAELVLSSHGPRFIAGDFNCDTEDLQVFTTWRLAGWEEIQHLAEKRFSQHRLPTSKGKAIRDHLWLSPELQQWLLEVHVDSEHFADHAILYGRFRLPESRWWHQHWPMPSNLPWQHLRPDRLPDSAAHHWDTMNMSQSFVHWSRATEQALRTTAYCQRATATTHWHLQVDQMSTWRAIIHAHGFRDGFRRWWLRRPIQHVGSPPSFPEWPPSHAIAQILLHDFEANFRQFESWHFRRRHDLVQARHLHHNQVLTKQLKQGDYLPITHLVKEEQAQILQVNNDHSVRLSCHLHLQGDQSITLNLEPAELQQQQGDDYYLNSDLLSAPGQTVVVRTQCNTFQAIESELANLWTPIWQKHSGLALSHWNRIVAFGLRYMPKLPPLAFQWTSSQFAYLTSHYRKRITRGPDAWSRDDIAHLPAHKQADLVNMFHKIQEGADWPQQLVTGFVIPIRKTPIADQAKHYRPIVLISFLYRLWATGICRAYLPYLTKIIPTLVFGYVPGRRAEDVWFLLQTLIQSSYTMQSELLGYNADLVKCFNTLPRAPILLLLQLMGFPTDCAKAWNQALTQLQRRFRIASHTGDALLSSTGFPEGDPLSCIAMLAFNTALDTYLKIYSAGVACPVFVDNIQLVASALGELCHGINVLQVFMDSWDICLDPGKCFAWATTPDSRRALRNLGYATKLAAKDLGAQMTYSRVSRTQVAQSRIGAVADHWRILRHSSAPRWAKLVAIRTITWPKVLHGVANRLLPVAAIDQLRSAAMRALHWDRAGASPHVRWSLMQLPQMDPEYQQLWQVLSTFWRMVHQFPLILELWLQSGDNPGFRSQGPLHVVVQCLGYLDWHLDAQLCLWIQHLRINFWTLSLECLQLLLQYSWHQKVCLKVRHRKDFAGLHSIHWAASFRSLVFPQRDAAELLATIQDGTFFTSHAKAHFDDQHSGLCASCQQPDTVAHRALHCPYYHQVRRRYPAEVRLWSQRSMAFTHHGLHPANPHHWEYWQALLSLPDCREDFFDLTVMAEHTFIFTDGSCSSPKKPSQALAAWSVITLEPQRTLSQGPVPGLIQSIDLAEAMAVHSAFLWVLRTGARATIFSDSQYALDNFRHLQKHLDVPPRWKHQGLWQQALKTVEQLDHGQVTLQKISSHMEEDQCASPRADWCKKGNDFADRLARWQNHLRSDAFMATYSAYCAAEEVAFTATRAQLSFLTDLANLSLSRPTECSIPEEASLATLGAGTEANDASLAAQLGFEALLVDAWPLDLGEGVSFLNAVPVIQKAPHAELAAQAQFWRALLAGRVPGSPEVPAEGHWLQLPPTPFAECMPMVRSAVVLLASHLDQEGVNFETHSQNVLPNCSTESILCNRCFAWPSVAPAREATSETALLHLPEVLREAKDPTALLLSLSQALVAWLAEQSALPKQKRQVGSAALRQTLVELCRAASALEGDVRPEVLCLLSFAAHHPLLATGCWPTRRLWRYLQRKDFGKCFKEASLSGRVKGDEINVVMMEVLRMRSTVRAASVARAPPGQRWEWLPPGSRCFGRDLQRRGGNQTLTGTSVEGIASMRCHRIRPPIGLSARRVARRDTEFDALDRPEMGDGLGLKGLTLTQTFQDLKPWTPLFKLKSGISDQTDVKVFFAPEGVLWIEEGVYVAEERNNKNVSKNKYLQDMDEEEEVKAPASRMKFAPLARDKEKPKESKAAKAGPHIGDPKAKSKAKSAPGEKGAMTQSQIEEAKIQEQSDTRARIRSGLAETAGYMMFRGGTETPRTCGEVMDESTGELVPRFLKLLQSPLTVQKARQCLRSLIEVVVPATAIGRRDLLADALMVIGKHWLNRSPAAAGTPGEERVCEVVLSGVDGHQRLSGSTLALVLPLIIRALFDSSSQLQELCTKALQLLERQLTLGMQVPEETAMEIFDSLSVVLLALPGMSNQAQAAMVAASKHMISSTDQLVRLADMYLAITMGLSDGQRAVLFQRSFDEKFCDLRAGGLARERKGAGGKGS
ncbi:unnamed protein product [Durusdinium trenchii]|uniref:RNase H type-1 domain-containing protein n=1 Tax=Durusdinium trenchii TaxID=1381693 RepID=A0ABP0J678_9DINO